MRFSVTNFTARRARFVRLDIRRTHGNTQPALDEFEVFGPDSDKNLALADHGAVASASSVMSGYAIHAIEHLNDGRYSNNHSWIAATSGQAWVQIELPQPAVVDRVVISRDRSGTFSDRVPAEFEVLISMDGQQWQSVATGVEPRPRPRTINSFIPIERLPEKSWEGVLHYTFLRERELWRNMPNNDYLSPLVNDRPAEPGGPPYWGRIARLEPLERVLVLFEEMIERLSSQELNVSEEVVQLKHLRQQADLDPHCMDLYIAARQAKRDLFFRDPALEPIERILFAKRHPYLESHNYSEHMDGILEPGGGVFVLHIPRDQQGRFWPDRAVIEQLFDGSNGIVREPVADFDAETIFFAYRPDEPLVQGWESYWHMYSMSVDGSNMRKLTTGAFHDFDATPLPDGGLAFHTTRCKGRFLCWEPQLYVLYRMDTDGRNMQRLSHSNLSEWKPSVMQDGRILWTRSEYQDKGADFGHTLWAIRPDGTHPELVFGNNTPYGYSQAHEVPGTNEIVCTIISHGDHQGPTVLIDLSKGPFEIEAITNITPETRPQYQMGRSPHDTFRDPYPISRDHFLVAHNPDNRHNWGLYIIDRYGNRELLYVDPEISSKRPTPLRARPRPPVLPSVLNAELAEKGLGLFTIQNVYEGLSPTVLRGDAKYLRVAEEVGHVAEELSCGQYLSSYQPFYDWYAMPVFRLGNPDQIRDPGEYLTRTTNAPLGPFPTPPFRHSAAYVTEIEPGLYSVRNHPLVGPWPTYVAKASHGLIPIAEDGSASFLAPAEKTLYFQVLDADYNELQRMRSEIQLQPGEHRSCIGCHEDRHMVPPPIVGRALLEAPRHLRPEPWGTQPFDYTKVVQPVLNANCVSCHDGTVADLPDLRRGDQRIPASYTSLIQGGWVHYFNMDYGARHYKAEPLSFGTLQSRLWNVLSDDNHTSVSLDETEMRAIKLWIDFNCPLWGDYTFFNNRPLPEEENE